MRVHDILPYLVVLFVIIGTIASGPIFIAREKANVAISDQRVAGGSADVTVVESPDGGTKLRKSQHGTGVYILDVPSTVLNVKNVSGQPLLSYKVQIVELGYAQTEIAFLQSGVSENVQISFADIVFSQDRVKQDSYAVELSIVLRASDKVTLFYRNETIQVQH